LRQACLEITALEEALQKSVSGQTLRHYVAAAAALLAGFSAPFMLERQDTPTALAVAALAAAAAYFAALKLLPGDKARLTLECELAAARKEFSSARAGLDSSWQELGEKEALARLDKEAAEQTRLEERKDVTENLLSRAEAAKSEEDQAVAAAKSKAELLRRQMEADLKRFQAGDVAELLAKIEKIDNLHRMREESRRVARAEADLNAETFDVDLEKRIRELQRRVDETPERPQQHSAARSAELSERAAAELKKLAMERSALDKSLLEESEKLARLEGALGKPAAEIYVQARENQARLEDLELWRKAAEEAFQLLAELSNAGAEVMKNCVENAGPLFSAMTEGRYTSLRLESHSPFEQGGLTVTHKTLGDKPLEWLSAGAQDLVWLAMRMVFASSGWREPSFMILDEPFVALDARRAAQALSALVGGPLAGWQIILLTKSPELARHCEQSGLKYFTLGRAQSET
ncbi:MAG TPA: hypothetical protein PLL10_07125, partial [Elusimicrobiales bacterium]|nr:hypothetical protein [Elusimicrobiales bacterium]